MDNLRTHYVNPTVSREPRLAETPLVFVHGYSRRWHIDWQALLPHLTFTCYLPSYRGRGRAAITPTSIPGSDGRRHPAYVDSIEAPTGLWVVTVPPHRGRDGRDVGVDREWRRLSLGTELDRRAGASGLRRHRRPHGRAGRRRQVDGCGTARWL